MTDHPAGGVLVDSNVLLDIFTDDPRWAAWSEARLAEAFDAGQVVIKPIVYAEISVAFRAHRNTRRRRARPARKRRPAMGSGVFWPESASSTTAAVGGVRRSPLPDFYIGAHAAVTGRALLTRDANYGSQLPSLTLINP
jgi:predicted nucleic acid-binding protein